MHRTREDGVQKRFFFHNDDDDDDDDDDGDDGNDGDDDFTDITNHQVIEVTTLPRLQGAGDTGSGMSIEILLTLL